MGEDQTVQVAVARGGSARIRYPELDWTRRNAAQAGNVTQLRSQRRPVRRTLVRRKVLCNVLQAIRMVLPDRGNSACISKRLVCDLVQVLQSVETTKLGTLLQVNINAIHQSSKCVVTNIL